MHVLRFVLQSNQEKTQKSERITELEKGEKTLVSRLTKYKQNVVELPNFSPLQLSSWLHEWYYTFISASGSFPGAHETGYSFLMPVTF